MSYIIRYYINEAPIYESSHSPGEEVQLINPGQTGSWKDLNTNTIFNIQNGLSLVADYSGEGYTDLHLQYDANETPILVYQMNADSTYIVSVVISLVALNSNYTLPSAATYQGYNFNGWDDGFGTSHNNGDSFTIDNDTLQAIGHDFGVITFNSNYQQNDVSEDVRVMYKYINPEGAEIQISDQVHPVNSNGNIILYHPNVSVDFGERANWLWDGVEPYSFGAEIPAPAASTSTFFLNINSPDSVIPIFYDPYDDSSIFILHDREETGVDHTLLVPTVEGYTGWNPGSLNNGPDTTVVLEPGTPVSTDNVNELIFFSSDGTDVGDGGVPAEGVVSVIYKIQASPQNVIIISTEVYPNQTSFNLHNPEQLNLGTDQVGWREEGGEHIYALGEEFTLTELHNGGDLVFCLEIPDPSKIIPIVYIINGIPNLILHNVEDNGSEVTIDQLHDGLVGWTRLIPTSDGNLSPDSNIEGGTSFAITEPLFLEAVEDGGDAEVPDEGEGETRIIYYHNDQVYREDIIPSSDEYYTVANAPETPPSENVQFIGWFFFGSDDSAFDLILSADSIVPTTSIPVGNHELKPIWRAEELLQWVNEEGVTTTALPYQDGKINLQLTPNGDFDNEIHCSIEDSEGNVLLDQQSGNLEGDDTLHSIDYTEGGTFTLIIKESFGDGLNDAGFTINGVSIVNSSLSLPVAIDARLNFTVSPPPESLQATGDICFPKGTPVQTDQGEIAIEKLTSENTIDGVNVVAVVPVYNKCDYLVKINKHALGPNYPKKTTLISRNHRVFVNKKKDIMVPALALYNGKTITVVQREEHETIYNVLLPTHSKMTINGLVVETLHPESVYSRKM